MHITVNMPQGAYAVLVRRGLVGNLAAALETLGDTTGIFFLSSRRVWKHWGKAVENGMKSRPRAGLILFDDGEKAKTLATYENVCRKLVRLGADRAALAVAIGGGVVGDVAGFVAATYLRGIRLVHVPTTLVGQVDSAIGGKTGVNLPEGKNLLGAFYQPRLVLMDPQVLSTLPARQYRAGLYEVLKYGFLGDAELFSLMETDMPGVQSRAPQRLDWLIPRCVQAKAEMVVTDEKESGLRARLNLGHTFAHALETATQYRIFLHGEAVGWGMIAAARLSAQLKMLLPAEAARMEAAVRGIGPLPAWPRIAPEKLLQIMRGDKKSRSGRVRFVLPTAIGKVEWGVEAPERVVLQVMAGLATGKRTP